MTENGNDRNEEMPVVLYTSPDGKVTVNALVKDETLWMTQLGMAELFGCTLENVIMHLKNIYMEQELQDSATTKEFLVVRMEGSRQVSRSIKHYNLDAIIAVGYRVNSRRATQFRIIASRKAEILSVKITFASFLSESAPFARVSGGSGSRLPTYSPSVRPTMTETRQLRATSMPWCKTSSTMR